MPKYMVLYKTRDMDGFDKPLGFGCDADDVTQAAAFCKANRDPCAVIHVSEKETLDAAYEEYLWDDMEEADSGI